MNLTSIILYLSLFQLVFLLDISYLSKSRIEKDNAMNKSSDVVELLKFRSEAFIQHAHSKQVYPTYDEVVQYICTTQSPTPSPTSSPTPSPTPSPTSSPTPSPTRSDFEFVKYGGSCSDINKCVVTTEETCQKAYTFFGGPSDKSIHAHRGGAVGDAATRPAGCYGHLNGNGEYYTLHFNSLIKDLGTKISGNNIYGYVCDKCADFEFVTYGGSCNDINKCVVTTEETCQKAYRFFGGPSDKSYEARGGAVHEHPTRPAGCYGHRNGEHEYNILHFNSLTTDLGTKISGNNIYGYVCDKCAV